MLIRKATKDDTDTIVAIIAPYVDQVIANDEGHSRFKPEVIQTIFDREDIHYFVGEIDQQIVGIVAYMEPSHLMHFFIKKNTFEIRSRATALGFHRRKKLKMKI